VVAAFFPFLRILLVTSPYFPSKPIIIGVPNLSAKCAAAISAYHFSCKWVIAGSIVYSFKSMVFCKYLFSFHFKLYCFPHILVNDRRVVIFHIMTWNLAWIFYPYLC